jgi:sn-glycerol 3-phosphate transport system permease protein
MDSTDVMVYAIYQDAFINYRFGTGSAQALVLFVLILIMTVIQFQVFERKVHYQ